MNERNNQLSDTNLEIKECILDLKESILSLEEVLEIIYISQPYMANRIMLKSLSVTIDCLKNNVNYVSTIINRVRTRIFALTETNNIPDMVKAFDNNLSTINELSAQEAKIWLKIMRRLKLVQKNQIRLYEAMSK